MTYVVVVEVLKTVEVAVALTDAGAGVTVTVGLGSCVRHYTHVTT